MKEVAWFHAVCGEGRLHLVTAYRLVRRAPGGRVQAKTRLRLVGGAEVRRAPGGAYEADGLGPLVRVGRPAPRAAAALLSEGPGPAAA
jgi:hypothetical protein